MTTADTDFATDLKAWAKRMDLTRAQAAAALGDVPIATYNGWCVGRSPALEGTLRRLMDVLESDRSTSARAREQDRSDI